MGNDPLGEYLEDFAEPSSCWVGLRLKTISK